MDWPSYGWNVQYLYVAFIHKGISYFEYIGNIQGYIQMPYKNNGWLASQRTFLGDRIDIWQQ